MTEATKRLRCQTHGRVSAILDRVRHELVDDGQVVAVDGVAAWICPSCRQVLAISHEASGRIGATLQARRSRKVQEVRVPLEIEDLALGVNALLGTGGLKDPFTLPLHLGLRLVGETAQPAASWQRFDGLKRTTRARPRVHPDIRRELDDLGRLWGADLSSVVRWLTVLAADSLQSGLRATSTRHEDVFTSTSTVNVVPLRYAQKTAEVTTASTSTSPFVPANANFEMDIAA